MITYTSYIMCMISCTCRFTPHPTLFLNMRMICRHVSYVSRLSLSSGSGTPRSSRLSSCEACPRVESGAIPKMHPAHLFSCGGKHWRTWLDVNGRRCKDHPTRTAHSGRVHSIRGSLRGQPPQRKEHFGRLNTAMSLWSLWNKKDERAYLPTHEMEDSLDVLAGVPNGFVGSRSPFAIGVYQINTEAKLPTFSPMQLYYVSERVVQNRSKYLDVFERYVR